MRCGPRRRQHSTGATRVPGRNRTKTHDSELSTIFYIFHSGALGDFPEKDAWLYDTTWDKSCPSLLLSAHTFPKKESSWESCTVQEGAYRRFSFLNGR